MNILRIKKSNGLFHVELSSGQILSLKESIYVRHNLYKGKNISEKDIEIIERDAERQSGIDLALKKLTNRKTEAEIRQILKDSGTTEASIDDVIDYLIEYHFIDDVEYAHLFSRDKMKINGYGPIKIAFSLKRKGISESHITSALDFYTTDCEIERINDIVCKKYVRDDKLIKEKTKIIRFLMSRGFHYDAIKAVIKQWE